jgi:signal transduction histidine kinase/ActR/RegA family two-component response regulator
MMRLALRPRGKIASLGVLMLVAVASAMTLVFLLKQLEDQAWVEHTLDARSRLLRTLATLQDAETGERGFLLTNDESFLEPYDAAVRAIDEQFDQLARVISDNPQQVERLSELRDIERQRIVVLRENIERRRRATNWAPNIEDLRTANFLMDDARAIIAEMIGVENALFVARSSKSRAASLFSEVGLLASLLLSAVLGLAFNRDNQKQLVEAKAANDRLNEALTLADTEAERRERLEGQLRQGQKMEAIGQLTGGIAHDFNNMLAVVLANLNLLKRQIARGETDVQRFIDGAAEGAERAAHVTQRLLAFARQQPLAPQPIDANKFVSGMSEILRRTLGQEIEVETILAGGLWRTHVDGNELESLLLNLAVNARDAMPTGGKLTIETGNANLDEIYVREQVGLAAGQYVLIAVSDTGSGMPPEIIAKAFDPFFTTKATGKGTGLGLSQAYGFVKQSGGHIKIYSEMGHGTTIKIYLPRFHGESGSVATQPRLKAQTDLGRSEELILVVEDEERMRLVVEEAFRELGYKVIVAEDAKKALDLLDANPGVSLLFTDVVMPEMSGRELVKEALGRRPDLRVVYTTGFSRNAVIHNGVLDPDVNFLPKPFTVEDLARKVRSVLDEN